MEIKFDEYGQPYISPDEERDCVCLLGHTRAACNCRIERKMTCRVFEEREALYHDTAMKEQYGICARCWMLLQTPLEKRELPPDCVEVRSRLGESTRGRYAVPKKAVRSLEALLKDQRSRSISDFDLARARYSLPGYLEWESEASNRTVALYPWKFWHKRPEWAGLIESSASDQAEHKSRPEYCDGTSRR